MKRVFADTSYFIAMIVPGDVAHERAATLSKQSSFVVTSAWVMTELAAYLSAPANRSLFTDVLSTLRDSPQVKLVPATQELFDRAAELYADRPDKFWSLVDCTSFIIMQRENIEDALTSDHHFVQAGFNVLLSNPEK